MNLPDQAELQAFLDALPPRPGAGLAAGDGATIGPWKVGPGALFTSGLGHRSSCVLDAPSCLDPRATCLAGDPEWYGPDGLIRPIFWDEIWDGTIEHIRDVYARARPAIHSTINEPAISLAGTMIPAGGMGYGIVTLERDWGMDGYIEPCNTVAVIPTLVERIDRREGDDLNVGYQGWIDALDQAYAPGGE